MNPHNPDPDAEQSPEEGIAIERIGLNKAIAALAGSMLYTGPLPQIREHDDMETAFARAKVAIEHLQRHYYLHHARRP